MSTSELTGQARRVPRRVGAALEPAEPRDAGRLVRSELRLVLTRRKNLVLLAVLAVAPIALGIAVRASNPGRGDGGGPAFLSQITENGLFLVFTSLTVTLPVFLPLAVAVVSGDAIAGEASTGTLRALLVVPVSRTRMLLVKYAGLAAYATACALTVAVVGLIVGLLLFPHGAVTLLSGSTVGYGAAVARAALVTLYVVVMLCGVAAVGLFVSTLTEVPMAAMAAVAVLTVVCEIADQIPQIGFLHRYLFTHPWLNFGDLLRQPLIWNGVADGVLTQVVYIAIFGTFAWFRLTTKDITS